MYGFYTLSFTLSILLRGDKVPLILAPHCVKRKQNAAKSSLDESESAGFYLSLTLLRKSNYSKLVT